MRRIAVLLVAVLVAVLGLLEGAEAARKKQAKPAAPPKPIYEAPMRVVIVRNSQPTCEPSCPQWIAAEGEITDATPALFRKVLKQMGKENLPVIIRSPGGSINAALEIGKMLRQRKMTAAVGSTIFRGCSPADTTCKLPKEDKGIYTGMITEDYAFCNSACPMLLAGATTRYASYRTSIGLHEPKTTWLRTRTNYREYYRIVNGKKKVTSRKILSKKTYVDKTTYGLDNRLRKRLAEYYKSMGVDVGILEETVKAKYKDIYFLPDDKRASLKLRTTMEQAVFLGNPNLCGSGATSAVCVIDKSRDPKALEKAKEKSLGIDPDAKPMTFRLVELASGDCDAECPKMIVAEGRITPTTQDNFVTFQTSVKPGKAPVVLNSQGGDISAAMHLAQRIRISGAATIIGEVKNKGQRVKGADIVEGTCRGVCAVVFAGGVSRFVTAKQKIELFHPDILSGGVTQKAVQLNSTLFTLDVKRDLMSTLHKLKKGKSVVITAEDALRFGLATDIKPFQTVIELNDCKLTAKPDLCQSDHAAKKTVKPKAYHRLSSEFWFALSARVVVSDRPHNSNAVPVWLALDGRIMPNTDQVVETYYKQLAPLKPTAVINSPGGDLGAAYRLAMFFKREGINTAFGLTRWSACDNPKDCRIRGSELDYQRGAIDHNSVCEGACLIAFAGGRKRMTGGSTAAKLNDLQSLNMFSTVKVSGTELAAMFDAIGSGPELAQKVTQIPEGEAIFLNEQQLAESGLVNTTDRTGILADAEKCAPGEGPVVCLPPK